MGASQMRCCGTLTDKQHQLKLPSADGQLYTPCDAEAVGNEHLPGHPDLAWPPAGQAYATADGMLAGSPRPNGAWACCVHGSADEKFMAEISAGKERLEWSNSTQTPPENLGDEGPCKELLVDLAKPRPDLDLGLRVLHRGVGVLVVAEIYPGGAVEAANICNAMAGAEVLEVGDQIAMVNGVGGDDTAMAEECKKAMHLTLGVRRMQRESVIKLGQE